jgi:hypothetical protein
MFVDDDNIGWSVKGQQCYSILKLLPRTWYTVDEWSDAMDTFVWILRLMEHVLLYDIQNKGL